MYTIEDIKKHILTTNLKNLSEVREFATKHFEHSEDKLFAFLTDDREAGIMPITAHNIIALWE